MTRAVVDTDPLVAFFDSSERHHDWVAARIETLDAPLIQNGALAVTFRIEDHLTELRSLLQKYRDTPMSPADACVVRMAELHDRHAVLTLDSDFTVYRKHGRTPLTLIHPDAS